MKPAIALYQPDIAGNTGTLMRLCACMGCELHIIEPAGFRTDDHALKRSGMDYAEMAIVTRHVDYEHFESWRKEEQKRLVLLTTKTKLAYTKFEFSHSDILLLGRESEGVPDTIHKSVDAKVTIPMLGSARSLNQAISASMVFGEALRQTTISN